MARRSSTRSLAVELGPDGATYHSIPDPERVERQRHLARRLVEGMELPVPFQPAEWAVVQVHVDPVRWRQGVPGREPGMQPADAEIQPRHDVLLVGLDHFRRHAPVEARRIGSDVVDQREHARGGVFDECAAFDGRHDRSLVRAMPHAGRHRRQYPR